MAIQSEPRSTQRFTAAVHALFLGQYPQALQFESSGVPRSCRCIVNIGSEAATTWRRIETIESLDAELVPFSLLANLWINSYSEKGFNGGLEGCNVDRQIADSGS